MKTEIISEEFLDKAACYLREGEPVAFPTETVYGLGAPVFHVPAIGKIFEIKGRPSDNPLIIHLSDLDQLSQVACQVPPDFYRLAEVFFPGPLTVVLQKHPAVPSIVSAGLETVGVRMPLHPIARKLIEMVGEPLVAPSANLSGKPSSTTARHVLEDFEGKIRAVVEGGRCALGIESTVLSLVSDKAVILRPGAIRQDRLEEALGKRVEMFSGKTGEDVIVSSPGMKYRHYAPHAGIKLFCAVQELIDYCKESPWAPRMFLSCVEIPEIEALVDRFDLSIKELYSCLRFSDACGYQEILVFCDPDSLADDALMDRLRRASQN